MRTAKWIFLAFLVFTLFGILSILQTPSEKPVADTPKSYRAVQAAVRRDTERQSERARIARDEAAKEFGGVLI